MLVPDNSSRFFSAWLALPRDPVTWRYQDHNWDYRAEFPDLDRVLAHRSFLGLTRPGVSRLKTIVRDGNLGPVDALVRELENQNSDVRDAAYGALNSLFRDTSSIAPSLVCASDFGRFIEAKVESRNYPYGKLSRVVCCGRCRRQRFAVVANRVVTALDAQMPNIWQLADRVLTVNALRHSGTIDLDSVFISQATDAQIIQFVQQIRFHWPDRLGPPINSLDCHVRSVVSEPVLRLLKHTFGQVICEQPPVACVQRDL